MTRATIPIPAVLAGLVAVVGAKTPALFVIGFVPMMLTAFAFRELARQNPDCGSTFTWATRAFGPNTSLQSKGAHFSTRNHLLSFRPELTRRLTVDQLSVCR